MKQNPAFQKDATGQKTQLGGIYIAFTLTKEIPKSLSLKEFLTSRNKSGGEIGSGDWGDRDWLTSRS